MKRLKIIILVLFMFASVNSLLAQPKAVVNPITSDFGDIIQDSVVTTFYVITNEGNSPLKITKVNASCGCTAVMPEKNELKQGESTKIMATFNSKGRSGKQNKIITIDTNDPQKPTIKLSLTGNVIGKESHSGIRNSNEKVNK